MRKNFLFMSVIFVMSAAVLHAQDTPPAVPNIPNEPEQPKYMIVLNGSQSGPYGIADLERLAGRGEIHRSTLVWKEGMTNWAAAGTMAELAYIFPQNKPASDSAYDEDRVPDMLYFEAKHDFNRYLAAGIVCASLGTSFLPTGVVLTYFGAALLFFPGIIMLTFGPLFLLAHCIVTPLCSVGFGKAGHVANRYYSRTGRRLFSLMQKTSVDICYDRDKIEAAVAMAIKL